jgi:hypothetical protein
MPQSVERYIRHSDSHRDYDSIRAYLASTSFAISLTADVEHSRNTRFGRYGDKLILICAILLLYSSSAFGT